MAEHGRGGLGLEGCCNSPVPQIYRSRLMYPFSFSCKMTIEAMELARIGQGYEDAEGHRSPPARLLCCPTAAPRGLSHGTRRVLACAVPLMRARPTATKAAWREQGHLPP